jgi:hypothetical protein
MRHAVIKFFLRELKESGLIEINWCKSEDMTADFFTKNRGGQLFKQHTAVFCGEDDYG